MGATSEKAAGYIERLWDLGQQHLVAGRYVAARADLEAAEALAWRAQESPLLARIYLPLLEARRQIRQNAVEGVILITTAQGTQPRAIMDDFFHAPEGTLICGGQHALKTAGSVGYVARTRQSCLEGLVLLEQKGKTRLASLANPTFAAGLPIKVAHDAQQMIDPTPRPNLAVPLPPAGRYPPSHPLHALARESLLVAWEALAMKWQARHPLHISTDAGWEEMAWLRLALRLDPACEPIFMRLIALAENLQRR